MRRTIFLFIALVLFLILHAQPPGYPQNYFRNPLDIPMKLAANFGELRPDHWHMGLDIRTDQKVNMPVYAAAEGYIAHIGIRPESFGRFIIINHPNGLSTLYGHLNDFFPALEQYVTAKQYSQQSWAIELDFTKTQFPVAKGQFIAYSGTTGSSEGPHVHFEIRDTKTDRCLNTLFFGLPVADNVPPSLQRLAMYDRRFSLFQQLPVFYPVKNTDSGYVLPKIPVIKTGIDRISFAIEAFDRSTGSTNPNGIYSASIFLDNQLQIGFALDSLSYKETLYVNAQVDYKYHYDGGVFLQHLSRLPGDHGNIYHPNTADGVIFLRDTLVHHIRIEIKDANLNSSHLDFNIQYNDQLAKKSVPRIVYGPNPEMYFIPNRNNILRKPDFELDVPENALYDMLPCLYFQNKQAVPYAVTAAQQVNDASIPLQEEMTVKLKPNRDIPAAWKDKLVIRRSSRGAAVHKAQWETDASGNTWLTAKFRDFGNFQAFADTVGPLINELGSGDTADLSPLNSIIFRPTDNFGVIRNFRAELDGQWLRFTNDKGLLHIYNFDERCPYGVHELKISAEDLVGNITHKTIWFKRYPYTPPKKKVVRRKVKKKKRK